MNGAAALQGKDESILSHTQQLPRKRLNNAASFVFPPSSVTSVIFTRSLEEFTLVFAKKKKE